MSVFCLLLAAVLPSFPTLRQDELNSALEASPIGSSISELTSRDPLDGQVPGHQTAPKETEPGGTLSSVDQQVEGIEHLAKLWGINDPKVKEEVTTCLKNTKGHKGVIGEKKDHFDIACKQGSVITIGIKKKGIVTVWELSQALKKLPEVEGLFLDSSNISGQIADLDLSQHHRLKKIQMRWCVIEGELKDLRLSVKLSGTGLEALKLSGKGVRGSLSDLKKWTRLLFLDLQKTSVNGNLSTDFGKPETLQGLWLQDTDVTGDITDLLKRAKELKYLDFTDSEKVYGKIGRDWTGDDILGEHVTELRIGKTKVTFDVPERLARERRFFPNLAIVSVKGSNLAMDVWEFLYPFSSIRFLKKVDASGCDLFGTVHTLSGESADGYSYAWRLEHLELANNKITGLLGNPGPKKCMLDARGNPLKQIHPSYFQNLMLLDIRNTNYTISEDVEKVLSSSLNPSWSEGYTCTWIPPDHDDLTYDILASPHTFAPDLLCNCTEGFAGKGANCEDCSGVAERSRPVFNATYGTCCGCPQGQAYIKELKGCFKCYQDRGEGCDGARCAVDGKEDCKEGYCGALCTSCEEGYQRKKRKCVACSDEPVWPLVVVAVGFVGGLAFGIWFFVFRPKLEILAAEKPWKRRAEFLEQALMFLSYLQVLKVLQSTLNVQVGHGGAVALKIGDLLEMLSLQCFLGYTVGRTLQAISSVIFLPVLCLLSLFAGLCRGHILWGMKLVLLLVSVLYIGTVQATFANTKCVNEDADGLQLHSASYFPEFPHTSCNGSSLTAALGATVFLNGALIPGSLLLLGMFVKMRTAGVYATFRNFVPRCKCTPEIDGVQIQILRQEPSDKVITEAEESSQTTAMHIYAAVFSACIGEAVASKKLQISRSQSGLSVKILAADGWPNLSDFRRTSISFEGECEARWLSDVFVHRNAAQQALKDSNEVLWVAVWGLFKRYSLQEAVFCEGLHKGFLFVVTALCTWKSTVPLAGILLLGAGVATGNGMLFGSKTRNEMAAVFSICLGAACMMASVIEKPSMWTFWSLTLALPILFWIHCQLVGGDQVLQAHRLLAKFREIVIEDVPLEETLEPITWDLEKDPTSGPYLRWLLAWYRGVAIRSERMLNLGRSMVRETS